MNGGGWGQFPRAAIARTRERLNTYYNDINIYGDGDDGGGAGSSDGPAPALAPATYTPSAPRAVEDPPQPGPGSAIAPPCRPVRPGRSGAFVAAAKNSLAAP